MKKFEARVLVIYSEVWAVEAETEEQAKELFLACDEKVVTDDEGTVESWRVTEIKES